MYLQYLILKKKYLHLIYTKAFSSATRSTEVFTYSFIVKVSVGKRITYCRHLAMKGPIGIQPYSRRPATPVG